MFLIKKELVYRLMKKDNDRGNFIKKIWSGRAAQIFAVTATVFLCFLTVFEYMALRMEWDIPIFPTFPRAFGTTWAARPASSAAKHNDKIAVITE